MGGYEPGHRDDAFDDKAIARIREGERPYGDSPDGDAGLLVRAAVTRLDIPVSDLVTEFRNREGGSPWAAEMRPEHSLARSMLDAMTAVQPPTARLVELATLLGFEHVARAAAAEIGAKALEQPDESWATGVAPSTRVSSGPHRL